MHNRKFSIILTVTAILVLFGGLCFVGYSAPPEGKGKKISTNTLGVYNGTGEFLGYYLAGYASVLDPDLGRRFRINVMAVQPFLDDLDMGGYMFFSDNNCQSDPYVNTDPFRVFQFAGQTEDNYYMIDINPSEGRTVLKMEDMHSRKALPSSPCEPDLSWIGNPNPVFPIVSIPAPWWTNIVLEHPIEIRPID